MKGWNFLRMSSLMIYLHWYTWKNATMQTLREILKSALKANFDLKRLISLKHIVRFPWNFLYLALWLQLHLIWHQNYTKVVDFEQLQNVYWNYIFSYTGCLKKHAACENRHPVLKILWKISCCSYHFKAEMVSFQVMLI